MVKMQTFGDKAARGQSKKDWKYVKYVESVLSDKTGKYRFNEKMIRLEGGETLDAALKRMNELSHAQDIEMPTFEEPAVEEKVEETVEDSVEEEKTEEAPASE